MRLFRHLVLALTILAGLGAGVSSVAATALAHPSAPVVHTFHTVIPLRANTANSSCSGTTTWLHKGGVQKSFNSGQIDEFAEVEVLVLASDNNTFCNLVSGNGWLRCNFGCTGTSGFIDLYLCNSLNGPCPTKVEHTGFNFTTFYGAPTAGYAGFPCDKFQTDAGVPAPGGGYWYTTSQITGFNVFC